KLGTPVLEEESSRDVTSEFVDLGARLRNARAQEHVLLGILQGATTVSATLEVQRTLSDVQLQIEQLVGQQRALQNRAVLGTIVVDLFEAGKKKPPPAVATVCGTVNPRLAEAWDRAKSVFFGLLYCLVLCLGVAVQLG